ncbi:20 kDa chaperonin [Cardamine amara subsp. amara]|uniref:20 kDa chaperonin n=1 Tax=Cardamine amara subsp. amara TaxID=228776 RepID=A0ABD0ZAM7_CARAN
MTGSLLRLLKQRRNSWRIFVHRNYQRKAFYWHDEEGNAKRLPISTGSTVLYSKYTGNDFKGKDGSNNIILRAWDIIAIFS